MEPRGGSTSHKLLRILFAIVFAQMLVSVAIVAVTAFVYSVHDSDKTIVNDLNFHHSQIRRDKFEDHSPLLEKTTTGGLFQAPVEIDNTISEYKYNRTRRRSGNSPCGKAPFTHVRISETDTKSHNWPKKKFILVTTTNWEFVDITENWLESIRHLDLKINITMVCEDKQSYTYFKRRATASFRVMSAKQFKMADTLRRGPTFQDLILKRIIYVRETVKLNQDVLLADIDAVWVKDPLIHIWKSYNKYDIWVASGKLDNLPCPCFMYLKASDKVIKLTESWVEQILEDKTKTKEERDNRFVTDQFALKPLLEKGMKSGNLKVKWLEKKYFPTGNLLIDEDWFRENKSWITVAHANNMGRHNGKKAALQKLGLWHLSH